MSVDEPTPTLRPLVILGGISWCLYAVFAWLSQWFGLDVPGTERPIVAIWLLLGILFVLYLLAIRAAIRADGRRDLLTTIVIFAAAFRALLLFTEPFQEIDIYRYMWDGQTTLTGVSPFRYAPEQVRTARLDETNGGDLNRLVRLRDNSQAVRTILARVHFAELPTVYPPTSQAVFVFAAALTPDAAGVSTHLLVMKAWILVFDFGILWGLIAILRFVKKPIGWAVAYGWCPLVMKEFANSGHLDSIAICLTTWAVFLLARAVFAEKEELPHRRLWLFSAAAVLALAAGAKLYPVILVPLFAVSAWRTVGWKPVVGSAAIFSAVVLLLALPFRAGDRTAVEPSSALQSAADSGDLPVPSYPMLPPDAGLQPPVPDFPVAAKPTRQSSGQFAPRIRGPKNLQPPVPPPTVGDSARSSDSEEPSGAVFSGDPQSGLRAFLTRWKMNDFLFLIVIENLTPYETAAGGERAWFAVVPASLTSEIVTQVHSRFGIDEQNVPFFIARAITAVAFLIVALCFAGRASNLEDPRRLLEAVFLTLAWFFLLLPTQNPWYWIWALPFVPFARSRVWLAVSGLVTAYYLRFWFVHHFADHAVRPTHYAGAQFFDFVVTWIEFGPWFLILMVEVLRRRRD